MNTSVPDPGPPDAKSDTLGGIVMLTAAALALVWANSPWASSYGEVLAFTVGPATLGMAKSLGLWISDGLMAIFFLYVGLEIKREMVEGQLSSRDRIALPAIAALGGMIVPALFFLAFNRGDALAARGCLPPAALQVRTRCPWRTAPPSRAPQGRHRD